MSLYFFRLQETSLFAPDMQFSQKRNEDNS